MVIFNRERRAGILVIGYLFVVPVAAHGQAIGMFPGDMKITGTARG
jgi:hypothetical protein